jgi:Fe-S-cluster containining protein
MARVVTHRYVDPLSEIWLATAARLGLEVRRVADSYASTDGAGVMQIAESSALDPDDSLAQMVFHEICHSLVEGEESFARVDWGIDNTAIDLEHVWREHACLRTQWVLSGRYGLRVIMAPTTDFRAFWDQLGDDVLADRSDLSVQAAMVAIGRAARSPWAPVVVEALQATARISGAIATVRDRVRAPKRAAADTELPSLWTALTPAPELHRTGLPMGAGSSDARCGSCAWRTATRGSSRCRQAGAKIEDSWAACERYERDLDCQQCGACCRAAYHSVEVARRDPMLKLHPELVVDRGSFVEIRRSGDRCAALRGGEIVRNGEQRRMLPMACEIYDDRPRTCRDFTLGSEHCLTARRRVGLSL